MRYVAVVGHKHIVFTSVIKIILYVRTDACLLRPWFGIRSLMNKEGCVLCYEKKRRRGEGGRGDLPVSFPFLFFFFFNNFKERDTTQWTRDIIVGRWNYTLSCNLYISFVQSLLNYSLFFAHSCKIKKKKKRRKGGRCIAPFTRIESLVVADWKIISFNAPPFFRIAALLNRFMNVATRRKIYCSSRRGYKISARDRQRALWNTFNYEIQGKLISLVDNLFRNVPYLKRSNCAKRNNKFDW